MTSADMVLTYHERTKHRLERYAAGPETLDWSMQPNPFREFEGSLKIPLPLSADKLNAPFSKLYTPGAIEAQTFSLDSVGALLQLSMGLSAWKEYGPDRWALRCNPSSGNLHPTEAYVLCSNLNGLEDGLYHYLSRDHVLEQRCQMDKNVASETLGSLWIGLSSIHWREAWKYGERAFRYCQLDVGHALGALRYAAGALGWQVKLVEACGTTELAGLLGLNRDQDFSGTEKEAPDLLLAVIPHPASIDSTHQIDMPEAWQSAACRWKGQANVLDRYPMYRWPVIDEVDAATEKPITAPESGIRTHYPSLIHPSDEQALGLILKRRSAQHFDGQTVMSATDFYHLLDCLLARPIAPWDVWEHTPCIHPVLFVHRVEGLTPGIYILPRHPTAEAMLRTDLRNEFLWHRAEHCPDHIPLFQLLAGDFSKIAKTLNCHQAIASNGCFSIGMLAEFEGIVRPAPWRYRQLYWEAGLLGQILYLEAEAAGLRGTGIGCFFDDEFHELLGLRSKNFQSLYHFTVGYPLVDERITTLPPYPGRAAHLK